MRRLFFGLVVWLGAHCIRLWYDSLPESEKRKLLVARAKKQKPQLPEPSEYGAYWFSHPGGPVIFPSGSPSKPIRPGKFFVCTEEDVLAEKGRITYFDTPQEALEALFELGHV